MSLKFLLLSLIILHNIMGSEREKSTECPFSHVNKELSDIQFFEDSLRVADCKNVSEKVLKLINLYQKSGINQTEISKKFDCSQSLVSRFIHGETPALKLVGSVHQYYMNEGRSFLLEIKETEASTWHFSDALSWLPFGGKSTSASSTRSSNEGTPQNDYLSSRGSTPPKVVEDPDKKPLLKKHETIQNPNSQSGLRRRHLSAGGDKK